MTMMATCACTLNDNGGDDDLGDMCMHACCGDDGDDELPSSSAPQLGTPQHPPRQASAPLPPHCARARRPAALVPQQCAILDL